MASTQEGYRWRNDDGSESAATWIADQDADVTRDKETATRLRTLVDHDSDPAAAAATLQYKRAAEGVTEWLDVENAEFEIDDLPGLWAWSWAGKHGENLRTSSSPTSSSRKMYLEAINLADPTNNFVNRDDAGGEPATEIVVRGGYTSPYPAIGIDAFQDGTQWFGQGMDQAQGMAAAGEFYLAAAFINSRTAGDRYLHGVTANGHYTRIFQGNNEVKIALGGAEIELTATGALPSTAPALCILEVYRDSSNNLKCIVNGSDATLGSPSDGSMFSVRGWGGGKAGGGSDWDDDLFELVYCDQLPSAFERLLARHRLNERWNFGISIPAAE